VLPKEKAPLESRVRLQEKETDSVLPKPGEAVTSTTKELPLFVAKLENGNNYFLSAKEVAKSSQAVQADPYNVVEQVVKKIKLEIAPGISKVEMQLEPKHLGKVQVSIVVENNHLSARLTTENVMAKEILQQNLPQLKEALQMQGVEVERLNVALGNGNEGRQQFASSEQTSSLTNGGSGELDTEPEINPFLAGNPQIISASMVNYLI